LLKFRIIVCLDLVFFIPHFIQVSVRCIFLMLYYCTNSPCNSYTPWMGSRDATILSKPNSFNFSWNSPTDNSSITSSICMVLCSPVNFARIEYTLSTSILGPVDGPSPSLWSFMMHVFFRSYWRIPRWSWTFFYCSLCFLAMSSQISSMESIIWYPIQSISSLVNM